MRPLRALVLVLKALLKDAGLNEVFVGGLSSYSVTMMVMSHLLLSGFRLLREGCGESNPWPTPEPEIPDLGLLFMGFLEWFGHIFSYEDQAVSVERVSPVHAGSLAHLLLNPVLSLPSPMGYLAKGGCRTRSGCVQILLKEG